MSAPLSASFSVRRRYTRSVNLERDLVVANSVRGYVPTPRGVETLAHILEAYVTPRAARAWSITGVYGTGKSAFAHFIAALVAPTDDALRRDALRILGSVPEAAGSAHLIRSRVPKRGLVRAVATAQREPIAHTVVRALSRGATEFWHGTPGRKPPVLQRLSGLVNAMRDGATFDPAAAIPLITDLATASRTGVILILDELGKNLEHAAQSGARDDVYLLQQLAELSQTPSGMPILVVTLLHQAFSEYATGLAVVGRAEWQKVQGRFEDVAFAEAPEHMLRLIGGAIDRISSPALAARIRHYAEAWHKHFSTSAFDAYVRGVMSAEVIDAVYPLHPVTALAVPLLCAKYAQNDRSLFTFLTSDEPHAFGRFLRESAAEADEAPTQKLHDIYDYFVDAAGPALVFRPQFQRWAEVHSVVADARALEPEALAALKTVGVLNLLTSAGPLRASRAVVLAALSDRPGNPVELGHWDGILQGLAAKGLLTYRRRIDEYRVWEGSDFDVEVAVSTSAVDASPLGVLLEEGAPLGPTVAQRHSHATGTLRYFERRYAETQRDLDMATCRAADSDGLMLYWVAETQPERVPGSLPDGRPLVLVAANGVPALRGAAVELAALVAIDRTEPTLQTDGVARREVRQRLVFARQALGRAVQTAFGMGRLTCWIAGKPETLFATALSGRLSSVCDTVYTQKITLRNELINRRELTSLGARARRELIEVMLQHGGEERLGLLGDGPDVNMYESVLRRSGIHRAGSTGWEFGPPTEPALRPAWDAIEAFCTTPSAEPRGVDQLIAILEAPPYGIKQGVIPVLLAAVLLYHADDVSVYREGTFLPTLGAEHFELLVKQPSKFAVKSFALRSVRLEVFKEIEQLLRQRAAVPSGVRNQTILGVVRPLVRFIGALPASTLKTAALSPAAIGVREALRNAREPDTLLFHDLPHACGLNPFSFDADPDVASQAAFRLTLFEALRELQMAYERRLERCAEMVHSAFAVRSERSRLREDLRVRAQQLTGRTLEPRLTAFVAAATNDVASEQTWLEALLMVIADKPFDRWADDDLVTFELRLSELARRFANVEAVLHDMKAPDRDGFDARRVTITAPDGREVHRLVWIDEHVRDAARRIADEIVPHLTDIPDEQRYAVITALAESVLKPRESAKSTLLAHAAAPRTQRAHA